MLAGVCHGRVTDAARKGLTFLNRCTHSSLTNGCAQGWAYHPDVRNLHDGWVQLPWLAARGWSGTRQHAIAHYRRGKEVRFSWAGIWGHAKFWNPSHEMQGPAGTGHGVVSMAGGRQGQGAMGEGLLHAIATMFFQNLHMYFCFLSRWNRLIANICFIYSINHIYMNFYSYNFIYYLVKDILNISFLPPNFVIGQHTHLVATKIGDWTKLEILV